MWFISVYGSLAYAQRGEANRSKHASTLAAYDPTLVYSGGLVRRCSVHVPFPSLAD